MPTRSHLVVPDVPVGYPLNPEKGFISVIVPEQTVNIITNPSVETATTGYTAVGSSIARSTTQQRHGVYSLAVTPTSATTDGVYYGTVSLTSGTTYTFSVDVYGAPGVSYRIYFATTGAAVLGTAYTFTGTGRWQRVAVTYTETSSTTRRLYLVKNGSASTTVFYADGWQLEAKAYPTTYCDGDQQGFVANESPAPYLWTGTAHASTSTRSAQTRSGGQVVNLDMYAFRLLAIVGLGMAPVSLLSTPFGLGDGALYQDTRTEVRSFSLVGQMDAPTYQQLQRQRSDLIDVLRPDKVAKKQPLVLRYASRRCTDDIGAELDLICHYAGGLEGNTDNLYAEKTEARFTMFLPYVQGGGDSAAAPSFNASVASADRIIQRSATGTWSALTTGTNGLINALAYGPDGSLYVGGSFTLAGGVANTVRIAKWDGSAWTALGTGAADGAVTALAIGADGSVYAGGSFSAMGGVANTVGIAKWNGSAWSAMGTGGAQVYSLAIGSDGTVYAAGNFGLMGGVANTVRIAKWNGSAWSALSTGITGGGSVVQEIAIGLDGTLYATGDFTTAGGTATADIAKWNGSAWSALSTGLNSIGYALAVGSDGTLYVGGSFTTAGGVAALRIAKWNGTGFSPLGSGMNDSVTSLAVTRIGQVLAGGAFTTAGGVTLPERLAQWNGSVWGYVAITFPVGGSNSVYAFALYNDALSIGYDGTGTATTEVVTTITNPGSAAVYPVVTLTGPGAVYQLMNTTTGDRIQFNLTLQASETATLDLTPGNVSFKSSFRGNILPTILPGSNLTTFRLQSGDNSISVFVAGTTSAATAVTIRWRPQYWSVDDGTE